MSVETAACITEPETLVVWSLQRGILRSPPSWPSQRRNSSSSSLLSLRFAHYEDYRLLQLNLFVLASCKGVLGDLRSSLALVLRVLSAPLAVLVDVLRWTRSTPLPS